VKANKVTRADSGWPRQLPKRNRWAARIAQFERSFGTVASHSKIAVVMKQRFEYKFVRLGGGWLGAKRSAEMECQEHIRQHAEDGWRLVQIFAPAVAGYGQAKYYELILEREVSK
jgi:hypothetical protein